MKALLRSIVVLALVLVTTGTATLAYFTSNVSATGNLITTGTLRLAVDSTAFGGGNSGYVVAQDVNGTTQLLQTLPTITNMMPGETRSVYVSLRNNGSLPFDYRANITGSWGNGGLDAQNVMGVSNVHRYAANNCTAEVECEDIYYWLVGGGWVNFPTAVAGDFGSLGNAQASNFFGHGDVTTDGVNTLGANQFTLFRIDFTMSPSAGNDFQGQTFTYSLNAQAKQTNAPAF